MCRVMITNHADFVAYDSKYGMLELMEALEKMCGGNGNGFVLLHHNKIVHYEKGVALKNKDIYEKCLKENWDYLIWHTRIKSVGNVQDSNCHPFMNEATNDCMAMNGTESSLRTLANAFGYTDTEVVFRASVGRNVEEVTNSLLNMSSVYIGCANGLPYAVNAGGSLERWEEGTKSLHASALPEKIKKVKTVNTGYVWINGVIDESRMRKAISYASAWGGYHSYGNYYDYDDDYYGYNYGYGGYGSSSYDYGYESKFNKSAKKTTAAKVIATPVQTNIYTASQHDKEAASKPKHFVATKTKAVEIVTTDTKFNKGYAKGYKEGYKACEVDRKTSEATLALNKYNEGYNDGYALGKEDGYAYAFVEGGIINE